MPDGTLAISSFACEDNDPSELDICRRTQFALGREYLAEPSGVEAYRAITELGSAWRFRVHFADWIKWNEPLPLAACHCVDVKDLPTDRSERDNWALVGRKIVVKAS